MGHSSNNESSTANYTLVPHLDSEGLEDEARGSRTTSIKKICLFLSSYLVIWALGYFAGSYGSLYHVMPHTSGALQLEQLTQTFHYNRSFSYPPSNHTNRAWREIFPEQGGFFIHPTIAPTRSTFSVFHQLHCLNHLRGAYFANQQAASEGRKLTDENLPVDLQPSHMRHCIDFLRQNLMCQADTTLEVVDESINGVHGFRTAHTCRNWEQLREWTSEQQRRQEVPQIE